MQRDACLRAHDGEGEANALEKRNRAWKTVSMVLREGYFPPQLGRALRACPRSHALRDELNAPLLTEYNRTN